MPSTKIIYLHFYFRTVVIEGRADEAWEPSSKLMLFLSATEVSLTCLFPLLCYYILYLCLHPLVLVVPGHLENMGVNKRSVRGFLDKLDLSVLSGLKLLIFKIGLWQTRKENHVVP